jgi:hypothetical protein
MFLHSDLKGTERREYKKICRTGSLQQFLLHKEDKKALYYAATGNNKEIIRYYLRNKTVRKMEIVILLGAARGCHYNLVYKFIDHANETEIREAMFRSTVIGNLKVFNKLFKRSGHPLYSDDFYHIGGSTSLEFMKHFVKKDLEQDEIKMLFLGAACKCRVENFEYLEQQFGEWKDMQLLYDLSGKYGRRSSVEYFCMVLLEPPRTINLYTSRSRGSESRA